MTTPLRSRRRGRLAGFALLAVAAAAALAAACNSDSGPLLDSDAAAGKQRARELNCTSCHTADGLRAEGPTWKGLYGSTVTLTDGRQVTADDAYLRRAILEPQVEVTQGYRPMQPVKNVTDADVAPIIAYIKALRDG